MLRWIGVLAIGVVIGAGTVLLLGLPTTEVVPPHATALEVVSDGLSRARRAEIAVRFSIQEMFEELQAGVDARADPATAWQTALASGPTTMSRSGALRRIAMVWVAKDPVATFQALSALPNSDVRRSLQTTMVGVWAIEDATAALNWTLAQQPSRERADMLASVARAVAQHAPDEMLELARTLDAPEQREIAGAVIETLLQTDLTAALRAMDDFDDPLLARRVGSSLVWTWAKSDPTATLEWILTRPPSVERIAWISTALGVIAERAPEEAMRLARGLDVGTTPAIVRNLLWQWTRRDPQSAAEWLDTSSYRTPDSISTIAFGYADHDPEAAFDWLMTQSAEDQQSSIGAVVSAATRESPELAQSLVNRIRDPDLRFGAVSGLVEGWMATNPRDAVRYLARFGDDRSTSLYRMAFVNWSQYDRDGAADFVNQLPASARDAATTALIDEALGYLTDVPFAEQMYERLTGRQARLQAAAQLYSRLKATDPKRAERYAPEANDSE